MYTLPHYALGRSLQSPCFRKVRSCKLEIWKSKHMQDIYSWKFPPMWDYKNSNTGTHTLALFFLQRGTKDGEKFSTSVHVIHFQTCHEKPCLWRQQMRSVSSFESSQVGGDVLAGLYGRHEHRHCTLLFLPDHYGFFGSEKVWVCGCQTWRDLWLCKSIYSQFHFLGAFVSFFFGGEMFSRTSLADHVHLRLIKGSLVEKLPIYEWDRSSIAQSSHSSVKS